MPLSGSNPPAPLIARRGTHKRQGRVRLVRRPPAQTFNTPVSLIRPIRAVGPQPKRPGRAIFLRYPPTPTGQVGPRLQLYRGPSGTMPVLLNGELAFTTDTKQAFCGDGTANHFIGGASSVPASSTSPGKKGQYASDGVNFYYCWSDNQWVRVAVSTF